jgi:hypothetical protein
MAMSEERMTRREIIKKVAYMTPAILTLLAAPSFASGGSGRYEEDKSDETYEGYNRTKKHRWNWDYEKDQTGGSKGSKDFILSFGSRRVTLANPIVRRNEMR